MVEIVVVVLWVPAALGVLWLDHLLSRLLIPGYSVETSLHRSWDGGIWIGYILVGWPFLGLLVCSVAVAEVWKKVTP